MALLDSSSSVASSVATFPFVSVGGVLQSTPPHVEDPVTLTVSGGDSVVVFDTVGTALRCLEYLRRNNQWFLVLQAPAVPTTILVAAVGYAKLLVAEQTPALAKLFQDTCPSYARGSVVFVNRDLGNVFSLQEALNVAGFLLPTPPTDNAGLVGCPVRLVDWFYQAGAASGEGTQAQDAAPLVYQYA